MKLNRLTGFSLVALATAPVAACGPKPNPTCDSGVWSPVVNGCVRPCGTRENPTYDDCYDTDAGVFIEAGSDRDARVDGAAMDAVSEAGRDVVSLPDADAAMEAAVEAGPACTAPEVDCGGACVSTQSSVAHCGACGRACTTSVANARPVCAMGACDFECAAGFELVGAACEVRVPRAIGPMTSATVTSQRPTLEWALPTGVTMATVDLCRDRAMTMGCTTLSATGSTVRPASALTAGVWFWRVRGRANGTLGTRTSPVWWFRVGARSADGDRDTSWGSELDVNGDGYADMAAGAIGAAGEAGRVDVFYGGGSGIAMSPDVRLLGSAVGDHLGSSVASAGDLNGDGFVDLVVGADLEDAGGRRDAGTASVFYGSALGLSTRPALVLEGVGAGDNFGAAVAGVGDVNRDGYADLAVGSPHADVGAALDVGAVYVFLGGVRGVSATPVRVISGGAADDRFGWAVAGAGDVNGDGFEEMIVGAFGATAAGGPMVGAASLFRGSFAGIEATPSRVLEGAEGWFGFSVAGAGDLNGDGLADVVVGESLRSPGGRMSAGAVSIFHGSTIGLAATPTRVIEGRSAGEGLGSSIAMVGDVNGDGFSDLLVGSPNASPSGRPYAGQAMLFLGSISGAGSEAARTLEGISEDDFFGRSIAGLGDVNRDGFADVAIGAPGVDLGGASNFGTVSIFQGLSTGLSLAPDRVPHGVAVYDRFGQSVASRSISRSRSFCSCAARPRRS